MIHRTAVCCTMIMYQYMTCYVIMASERPKIEKVSLCSSKYNPTNIGLGVLNIYSSMNKVVLIKPSLQCKPGVWQYCSDRSRGLVLDEIRCTCGSKLDAAVWRHHRNQNRLCKEQFMATYYYTLHSNFGTLFLKLPNRPNLFDFASKWIKEIVCTEHTGIELLVSGRLCKRSGS